MTTEPIQGSKVSGDSGGIPTRRFGCVRVILMLGLLLLMSTQYLNHTGFCYADMRYLTEKELTDRMLFGDESRTMSDEQKRDLLKERDGAEYPDCCRVYKNRFGWSASETLFNSTLGNYRYGFDYYYPAEKAKVGTGDQFKWQYYSTNSCGRNAYPDFGESLSQESYNASLSSNSRYWKELEDDNTAD